MGISKKSLSVTSIRETSGNSLSGYTGDAVDYSNLTFEATYDDTSTASVTPASCSPSVWGEAGTETITFSFEGTDVTCEVEGESLSRGTIISLSISGTPTNTQTQWESADLTGLTFTFGLEGGGSLVKTGAEVEAFNEEYPETPLLVIRDDGYMDDGIYKRAGSVNVAFIVGEGCEILGYEVDGTVSGQTSITGVVPTLTGISISGSWTDDTQDVNAERDYTGLTFTKSYSNHADVIMTDVGNRDLTIGGEIVELSPGNYQRRPAVGWTDIYTNEAPSFWFRRVDDVEYTRQGTETVNVAIAPAITTTVNISGAVTSKNITIDPTIAGNVTEEQGDIDDYELWNIFDGTQYDDECNFFVDLSTGEPITVSEGDVFWYVMMKSDYDAGNKTLAVPADLQTGLGPMIVGLGLDAEEPEIYGGLDSLYGGLIYNNVGFDANLTGEGTWTNEQFVSVCAAAPAGATDVDVSTYLPSDLTEIGKFVISVVVPQPEP